MKEIKGAGKITSRDSKAFNQYLRDINKIPLLSDDEEFEVATLASQGNQEAINKLVECNLKFVITIAKMYVSSNVSLGDLVNEGNIGLVEAAKRFDPTRGFKFISYAVWWIRQAITDYKSVSGTTVKLPTKRYTDIGKIRRVADALEQQLGRTPSIYEIADSMQLSTDTSKIEFLMGLSDNMTNSIDTSMTEDGFTLKDILVGDTFPKTDHLTDNINDILVNRFMGVLTDREQTIVKMFYGIDRDYPKCLIGISEEIGLTKERVRQIKNQAVEKLAKHVKDGKLEYLLT